MWSNRDMTDDLLRAIHLALCAARKQKEGVSIANRCLKTLLRVDRVHSGRANALARRMKTIFPFHRLMMDQQNATILVLGLTESKPDNTLRVRSIPSPSEIEKELGVETVTWSCNRSKPK